MINTRILTISATVAACAAGTSFALAQVQGNAAAPGSYSTAPAPYPPGGYPADYRRPGRATAAVMVITPVPMFGVNGRGYRQSRDKCRSTQQA